MMEWFQRLAPRERLLVVGGGMVGVLVLVFLLIIEPVRSAMANQHNRVEAQRQLLVWMRQSAAEARLLSRAQTAGPRSPAKPPYLLLDQAIRKAGLSPPERLEPQGKDGTQAQFALVDFNRLIAMLDELRLRQGLIVTDASITRKAPGQVSARITLQRAGG